jgi:hypothetical protein
MKKDDEIVSITGGDLEFVKDIVQDTSKRINNLETSMYSIQKDITEKSMVDKQLTNEMTRISQTLEKNTESLIEHMRRTEINEMNINELKNISEKIDSRLQPVERHIHDRQAIVAGLLKFGGILSGLMALISFAYNLLKR